MKKNLLKHFQFSTLVLFCIVSFGMLNAQSTATIGTGTSSGNTIGPIHRPTIISSTADFSRFRYVYTATELSTAGITPGTLLSQISWNKNSTFNIVGSGNATFKIYVKNTSTTVAVADSWTNLISGATKVYDGIFNTTNNLPSF